MPSSSKYVGGLQVEAGGGGCVTTTDALTGGFTFRGSVFGPNGVFGAGFDDGAGAAVDPGFDDAVGASVGARAVSALDGMVGSETDAFSSAGGALSVG